MNLEVRLFAYLRELSPEAKQGAFIVELNPGSKVIDLINHLKITDELDTLIIMVNGKRETMEKALHDGDRVGIFPPVGGG